MNTDRLLRPIYHLPWFAALLIVAACTTTPPPSEAASPGTSASPSTPTPTPVIVPSDSPSGLVSCATKDLALEHGIADAAAGSRFTILTLAVTGPEPCSLPAIPTIELIDVNGAQVILGAPAGAVGTIDLQPGALVTSTIQFNNWCVEPTAEPLSLRLELDDAFAPVAGGPFPNPGQLPPCNGPGDPLLTGSAWAPPSS
jgi:hypothetical protein